MFSYDISTCHCCGWICIFHHDNLLFKYNCNVIKPRHFFSKKHDAWKCRCNNFVMGNNFIVAKYHHTYQYFNHIAMVCFYGEFLNIPQNKHNASICDFCYKYTHDANCNYLYIIRFFFQYIKLL